MLKKLLGVAVVILTAVLYLIGVPFINKNTVTCIGGKSSGQFIYSPVFFENDGYQVKLDTEIQAVSFLRKYNCEIVFTENINGIENYYFYSSKLLKKQVLNGKKVNVHLAVSDGKIILGYPIIYGSY